MSYLLCDELNECPSAIDSSPTSQCPLHWPTDTSSGQKLSAMPWFACHEVTICGVLDLVLKQARLVARFIFVVNQNADLTPHEAHEHPLQEPQLQDEQELSPRRWIS
jgi:hypothetical protein